MAAIERSVATLRFFGDDLDPAEVTSLLGAEPNVAVRKGEEQVGSKTGTVRIAKTGSWRISATPREPEDLDSQIAEILGALTADPAAWSKLSRYEPDLFCGMFMGSSNDGVTLSPGSLLELGRRGIRLNLDIYDFVK